MDVRNCRRCKKIFNYITGAPICPSCREELEAQFQVVKKYVRDNRGVSIQEVAEACEVDSSQIRQWVREERLEFAEGSMSGMACESCGVMISSGRFCDKCKAALANGFAGARPAPAPAADPKKPTSASSKMRFLQ